jgi:hypothetical protein
MGCSSGGGLRMLCGIIEGKWKSGRGHLLGPESGPGKKTSLIRLSVCATSCCIHLSNHWSPHLLKPTLTTMSTYSVAAYPLFVGINLTSGTPGAVNW